MVDAVLEEAAKLAGNGLAPLNRDGDKVGAKLENGVVRTAPGFTGIYKEFVEGGWNALPFDPEFGGQGLPWLLATTVQEMWQAANMALRAVPAADPGRDRSASTITASDEQKATYPAQADLGRMDRHHEPDRAAGRLGPRRAQQPRRCRRATTTGSPARRSSSPTASTTSPRTSSTWCWRARPTRRPACSGISLFIVPKFLVNADGTLGERNDLRCVSLEHKLGIHASPTCVHGVRRRRRRGRLPGRRGRPRPRLHVHHDEQRPAVGRHPGPGDRRARLPAGRAPIARSRVQSKDDGSAKPRAGRRSSTTPTCAAC